MIENAYQFSSKDCVSITPSDAPLDIELSRIHSYPNNWTKERKQWFSYSRFLFSPASNSVKISLTKTSVEIRWKSNQKENIHQPRKIKIGKTIELPI